MGNFENNLAHWLDDNLTDEKSIIIRIFINSEGYYRIEIGNNLED